MYTLQDQRSRSSGHLPQPGRWRFLYGLTLAVVLSIAVFHIPLAYANSSDNTDSIIHWDQSMIYPGQNKGNPEGPVGEIAVVHGEHFTANTALDLVVVAGDSNSDSSLCQSPGTEGTVKVATATTDATGGFTASFSWPAGVGKAGRTRANSLCSYSSDTLISSRDDGPFTVLTDHKPTFSLSATRVAAGDKITISGQNWVPPQPVNVTIASCADCDPGAGAVIAGGATTTSGLTTGTFSLSVSIPANMPPNTYVVNVSTQNGPLDAYHINGLGVKQLAVTAAVVTPTPTTEPSPSVTAGSNPTVTAASTATTNTTGADSNSGGNSSLMIILVVLAVVLLAIGGAIIFMLVRRSKQTANGPPPASHGQTATPARSFGSGQASQPDVPQTPLTPFPSGYPMNTPDPVSDDGGAYSGYNQQNINRQNQARLGNAQSNRQSNAPNNAGFNNFQQNQPFQAQQGNSMASPGQGRSSMSRPCIRCGSPLSPGSPLCGICGTYNPAVDPNDPTVAY